MFQIDVLILHLNGHLHYFGHDAFIYISEKKLHRRPGLYFLTDPTNIETKKSWTIFREDEISKLSSKIFKKS